MDSFELFRAIAGTTPPAALGGFLWWLVKKSSFKDDIRQIRSDIATHNVRMEEQHKMVRQEMHDQHEQVMDNVNSLTAKFNDLKDKVVVLWDRSERH